MRFIAYVARRLGEAFLAVILFPACLAVCVCVANAVLVDFEKWKVGK